MRLFFVLYFVSIFILPKAKAQETLPDFSASLKSNGKVLISWRNNYPAVVQISIQRSNDSLHNFTTLVTVPDPRIPENGFVDGKSGSSKMYYRIFILFPNSKYTFTKSRRPRTEAAVSSPSYTKTSPKDNPKITSNPNTKEKQQSHLAFVPVLAPQTEVQTGREPPIHSSDSVIRSQTSSEPIPVKEEESYLILPKMDNSRIFYMKDSSNMKKPFVSSNGKIKIPTINIDKTVIVRRRDSIVMVLSATQVRRFSDSLLMQTKDTLFFVNADTLQIKPFIEVYQEPKEVYKISSYVFATKDGNITIALADCKTKNYFVAFYETDNTPIIEIRDIKDPTLIIDKTNFGHSGWFRFELYEDGRLREKNKLLIPKE
jgi:hypothetical protein